MEGGENDIYRLREKGSIHQPVLGVCFEDRFDVRVDRSLEPSVDLVE